MISVVIFEKIYVFEDIWIDEDGYVDFKNYCLWVGVYYGSEERVYLKFDFLILFENVIIVWVILIFYVYYYFGFRFYNIIVYGVLDDLWSEDILIWNN